MDLELFCSEIIKNAQKKSSICYCIFDLLYRTGIRYNDINLISAKNVIDDYLVFNPSKRNDERQILLSDVPYPFVHHLIVDNMWLYSIPYSTCVRELKKCIPAKLTYTKNKDLLIHVFRHNYMKKLYNAGHSVKEVALITGEKSINSAANYIFSVIIIEPFKI